MDVFSTLTTMQQKSKQAGEHGQESALNDDGVEELAQAADRLFYAMRRSRAATVGQFPAGLSQAQLSLLGPLAAHAEGDGLPVSKLAAHAGVSVPTATRMLNQLETKGVVTKRRSPADERHVLIRLTENGTCQLAALRDELRIRQRRALAGYTAHERRVLATKLHQLADTIAATMSESDQ
jgi:DNA-binding MarR family transcriptional regulator